AKDCLLASHQTVANFNKISNHKKSPAANKAKSNRRSPNIRFSFDFLQMVDSRCNFTYLSAHINNHTNNPSMAIIKDIS
ncbi:hypothetical protein, partial [Blautia producta]|uniref:hypothetical protein n=1 Tax=Blautia producta TaxID=33035 RepID=UPI001A9A6C15